MVFKKKDKKGMGRLLEITGKYRKLEYLGCGLSLLSSIALIGPFIAVFFVLKILLDSGGDMAILDTGSMIYYGILAVGFTSLSILLYSIGLLCTHLAAFKTMNRIRYDLMRHLSTLPLGFHIQNPSGKIRKTVDADVGVLEDQLAHQLPDLAGALVMPVAVVVVMLFFDWRLGIICLIPLILGFIIQYKWVIRRSSEELIAKYQMHLAEMENSAVEYVRGISVVKVFGQTVRSFKNFYSSIIRYKDFVLMYTMSMRTSTIVFMTLINASFLFLIPAGIIIAQALSGDENFLLSFVFFVTFIPLSARVMMKLLYTGSTTMMMNDSMDRIDALFKEPSLYEPSVSEMPSNNTIKFEKVSFSYSKDSAYALSDLSFTAEEGTVTAFVGASGSGKTTIANLIPRFWDTDSGTVSLGGVDVKKIKTTDLMDRVGFVFQNAHLFKTSIYENIRMGDPEASREEVMRAADLAQCSDFINQLPNGIDTIMGTRGTYLSGGEQQRIALARAFLKDTPVILLDEATAFADPDNEASIHKALDGLIKGKTVIMIAHRLSTVMSADKIIVLENGKAVEEGDHDHLMSLNGRYAAMWADYQKSLSWNIKEAKA